MALVTDRRMRLFHASARGATPAGRCCKDGTGNFNPRPPRGWRPRRNGQSCKSVSEFQSTPPARGATAGRIRNGWRFFYFNPRPPRGGRPRRRLLQNCVFRFQSTPPARGATCALCFWASMALFQSTPPARGATTPLGVVYLYLGISIHAPREGGDPLCYCA